MSMNARGFDPNAIRRQHAAALREGRRLIEEADRRGQAEARESENRRAGPDVERAITPETVER